MEFGRTCRITVHLKSRGYVDIFCDKIIVKERKDLSVKYYEFEIKGTLVAQIHSHNVEKFEYYKKLFDTETTCFTL